MKMMLGIAALCIAGTSHSSNADSSRWVVKSDGDTLWSDCRFERSLRKMERYLVAGNDTLLYDGVSEIKNGLGTFKRTPRHASIDGFAKLDSTKGDIGKYSISGSTSILFLKTSDYSKEYFYSVARSGLNRIEYGNLLRDFGEYKESRSDLDVFRRLEKSDHWLMGGGLLIAGLGGYLLANTSPKIVGKAFASAGTGALVVGLVCWNIKGNYLDSAFNAYFRSDLH